ncbi:ABC transporter permease [Eggerthella timonensis]|uniref:ABC transporter permease n=1 Tax=Eggerthella timonensis TaxID=1871008 RepID=UPI000C7648C0|nr:ABC transporter permease [Eggerthella timonensis]
MMRLIRNEFAKLKKDRSMAFLLVLALLPVLTGTAGAVIGGKSDAADVLFFVNNQFAMFYPMAVFILAGSLLCREWRDKTYLSWISYGIPKSRLLLSKMAICATISFAMAVIELVLLGALCAFASPHGLQEGLAVWCSFAPGFMAEALSIIMVCTCAGFLVAIVSRSSVGVSAAGVMYGFVSCFFIGSEWGFLLPGSFAYRVAMAFLDPATYYDASLIATAGGATATIVWCAALFLAALVVFRRKRGIEE